MHAIEVHRLSKFYGRTPAISSLSFQVDPGCIVGFLGPNGAGKSTTLRILCGLLEASSGKAFVHGVCVAQNPLQVKRMVGYMPENNPLPDDMRVLEYLEYRAGLKEIPARKRKRTISEVMELCDLKANSSRRIINQLSKGYRQRLGVADALLGMPKVIILDEPTVGLDPRQVLRLRALIEELRGKVTLLISSHILAEVEASCDQVLILNHGQLVAAGTPRLLKENFIEDKVYKILVKGPSDFIADRLKRLDPFQMNLFDREEGITQATLSFRMSKDPLTAAQILKELPSGTELLGFYEKLPTLEDVFLVATRRSAQLSDATLAPFAQNK
jgi:ABC-2 type transport system ATP-binding protein